MTPLPEGHDPAWTLYFASDDAPLGGMVGMDTEPSHWIVYFAVEDVEIAVRITELHGGSAVSPGFDTPFGRMAALTDPGGAGFWVV